MVKHTYALRRLFSEITQNRTIFFGVLVFGALVSAIQPITVKFTQKIIDSLKAGETGELFVWLPFALVGIFLVSGFSKYGYNTLRRTACERVLSRVRIQLYQRYLRLPLPVIDRSRSGELLSAIQGDLQLIGSGLDTIWDLMKEPLTFLGLMGFAFYTDWKLTLATLAVVPVVAWLFSRTGAAVKRYAQRALARSTDLMALAQETLAGSRVVKVFGLERPLQEKFESIQAEYLRTVTKSIRVQELSTPSVELVGATLMAGILVYGSHQIARGQMSAGELIAYVIALGLAQMPLKQMNNALMKLRNAESAAERVFHILDKYPQEGGDTEVPTRVSSAPVRFHKEISFENVSLSYGEKPALHSVSFRVGRGESVGLVGQSGSGKSSTVNLLARLYHPDSGCVRIDGVDIQTLPLAEVRQLFSFVTQDTFLFHDTIYENIRYGRPEATREEVLLAAERAQCSDFLARFPAGIETVVGDRGMCVSGGERQRVAIARALLRASPILVLDEATSNLDSRSETLVQRALQELMLGKTTFVIAHRFATVVRLNRLFVFDHGRISQVGNHADLVGVPGTYRDLFESQRL